MSSIFIRNAVDQMIFIPTGAKTESGCAFKRPEKSGIPLERWCQLVRRLPFTLSIQIANCVTRSRSGEEARRARLTYQTGDADLFGDDIREKAKVKFEQEIKDYETKNPNLPPTCDVKKR